MYPPILLMQPDTARSLMKYRKERIPAAEAKARGYKPPSPNAGLSGAMFPWQSAMTGVEACPISGGYGRDREIHIGGDIAIAAWQYFAHTQDIGWLRSTGWPLLSSIAAFWISKVTLDNGVAAVTPGAVGPLQVLHVVGPDEYHDNKNNSAYTSATAILALRAASKAARVLQAPAPAVWDDVASRLVVPFNATMGAAPGGLRPEYSGYPLGLKVKQADTVLLGFPLGFTDEHSSPALTANDLNYYAAHTDSGGPAMTWGIFCIGYASLGPRYAAQAAENFNRSFANVQPPFAVWMETPSGGTPNFLTGAGGFLQTVFSGYPGLRTNDTALRLDPRLVPGTSAVKLRGLCWRGNRIDVHYTGISISVAVRAGSGGASETVDLPHHRYEVPRNGLRIGASRRGNRALPQSKLSLMPVTSLAQRSQRVHVVIDAYMPAPSVMPRAALDMVDETGARHRLVPGVPVSLPLQAVALVPSASKGAAF